MTDGLGVCSRLTCTGTRKTAPETPTGVVTWRRLGLQIPVERFKLKRKLSQDKDDETRRGVIAALHRSGPFERRALADEMERELEKRALSPRMGRSQRSTR